MRPNLYVLILVRADLYVLILVRADLYVLILVRADLYVLVYTLFYTSNLYVQIYASQSERIDYDV